MHKFEMAATAVLENIYYSPSISNMLYILSIGLFSTLSSLYITAMLCKTQHATMTILKM